MDLTVHVHPEGAASVVLIEVSGAISVNLAVDELQLGGFAEKAATANGPSVLLETQTTAL